MITINNVFNQVGSIINEYAPEHFNHDLFNERSILNITTSHAVDIDRDKEYKNLKELITLDIAGLNNSYKFLPNVEKIYIGIASSIKPLLSCTKLKHITLRKFTGVNIHGLERLTLLEEFRITNGFSPISLKPLTKCPNLTTISVDNLRDISYFSECKNLRSITMNCYRGSLEPLQYCTKLKYLSIPRVRDGITPLKFCTNLVTLILQYYTGDLSPLSHCVNIEALYLCKCQSEDLTPLSELKKLRCLSLSSFVGDLTPLAGLKSLSVLFLDSFENSIEDSIKPLAELSNLQYLSLKSYDGRINHLSNLTSLTYINLDSYNRFCKSITALSGLIDLREVHLNSFDGDITPLLSCTNIKQLYLDNFTGKYTEFKKNYRRRHNDEIVKRISSAFPQLTHLHLASFTFNDLSGLAPLTSLHTLDLDSFDGTSLGTIANFPYLSELYLMNFTGLKAGINKYISFTNTSTGGHILEPLKACSYLKILQMDSFRGDYTVLNTCSNYNDFYLSRLL